MKIFLEPTEKLAFISGELKYTYEQLTRKVDAYCSLLNSKKHENIIIFSENRPEYIFTMYAGFRCGSIVTPVDHMSTPDELLYIVKDCSPQIIFTSKECLSKVMAALKSVRKKPEIFVFDKIKSRDGEPIPIAIDDIEKTALIIYTSGTTGSPKGVMLSYRNLLRNIDAVAEVGIYTKEQSFLMLLPIHHILPLLGSVIGPLCVQATIAMAPSMATDDILSTLSDGKVTIIIGVPRLYEALNKGIMDKINAHGITRFLFATARKINSQKFSKKLFKQVHQRFGGHLKYLVSGGAALDPIVGRNFTTLGFTILEGYGMSEAAPIITFPRPNNVKMGTTGQPLPGVEIKIVKGEILAKGPNIMQGYYNKPKETADVLKGGWLYTGDIGVLDENNFLTITGRKKDIIILPSGKNVNPEEIEEKLLNSYPVIEETAVFLKDNKLQAVIRFNAKAKVNDAESERKLGYEIINDYNNMASPSKKLLKFSVTSSELPRTRLGKIKRFELTKLESTTNRKTVKEPKYREYAIIKDFLENETGASILPDDHFEFDLGLDSLSKVGLMVFLEKTFGIKFRDENLNSYPNLLKLSEYVKDKKIKLQESIVNWADILKEKVHVKLPKSWFTIDLAKYMGKILFKLFFNIKGSGQENLPKPPFIIAPNHQSAFDGLFVASFLERRLLKKTFFYAKAKHFDNKFLKFMARINNTVVVDVNNDLKGSIQVLAEVLKDGKNIMIFPEGTRTPDGSLGDFKQTFAILSSELKVPVVPVVINGAYHVMPRGKHFPRLFKPVSISFLKPVNPDKKSYNEIVNSVKKSIDQNLGDKKAS